VRIDGKLLDLRTMADVMPSRKPLVGGRRHLGVGGDRVVISDLGTPEEAGIGIGTPAPWATIHCTPRGYDEHMSPIDRDGWLDVAALTPWREYWLELDVVGGVRVERSDSNGNSYRWYWPLPRDLWEKIR